MNEAMVKYNNFLVQKANEALTLCVIAVVLTLLLLIPIAWLEIKFLLRR